MNRWPRSYDVSSKVYFRLKGVMFCNDAGARNGLNPAAGAVFEAALLTKCWLYPSLCPPGSSRGRGPATNTEAAMEKQVLEIIIWLGFKGLCARWTWRNSWREEESLEEAGDRSTE